MKRIIFLHIPKCGGTSLSSVLQQAFPNNTKKFICGTTGVLNDFIALSQQERDDLEFFTGHQTYECLKHFTNESDVITFIRSPIKRLWSHYHFVRTKPNFPLYDFFINATFSEYIERMLFWEGQGNIDNLITRFLAGVPYTRSVNLEDVCSAIANSKKFKFIGFLENFKHDLNICLKVLSLPNIELCHANKNTIKPELPIFTRKEQYLVNKATFYDCIVYEYLLNKSVYKK